MKSRRRSADRQAVLTCCEAAFLVRRRFVPRAITRQEADRVRKIVAAATWRHTSSPRYADCPHRYLIKFNAESEHKIAVTDWDFFAQVIKECGSYRGWRGTRYKYLVIDAECFWVDWPALNRTKASVLDPA